MDKLKQQTDGNIRCSDLNTYWKDVKAFHFHEPLSKDLGDNYSGFLEGLRYWTDIELDKAKGIFRELYLTADQPEIRQNAALILFNILFSGREYNEINELNLYVSDAIKNDDGELVAAFSQFPNEQYIYNDKENVLSMEFSISGNPIIEVEINGHKKKLWLDTGAQVSVLSAGTAAECHVRDILDSSITADADTTKFNINARPAYIERLGVGSLMIENHPLMIMNDDMLLLQNPNTKEVIKIDGIIGWNAIQNIDIYIDYNNKVVRIKEPVKNIKSSTNMFVAGRAILKLLTLDNIPLYFGIDTGANQSSISENVIASIPEKNMIKKLVTVGTVGGMKQIEISYLTDHELLMKDGKKLRFENIRVDADHKDWAVFFELNGVVGSDLLWNTCLHIDGMNGIVEIGDRKGAIWSLEK